jgi:hypothetical protein
VIGHTDRLPRFWREVFSLRTGETGQPEWKTERDGHHGHCNIVL